MRRALRIQQTAQRGYAHATSARAAQPLSVPTLDSTTSAPPVPTPPKRSPRSIAVPTASAGQSQPITLTLRKRALDVESPAYGIAKTSFPWIWLRDVCQAPGTSVDSASKQKLFRFEDVAPDLKPWNVRIDEENHNLHIEWDRPLQNKGKPVNAKEESVISLDFLRAHSDYESWRRHYRLDEVEGYKAWDSAMMEKDLLTVPFDKLEESPAIVQAGIARLFRDGLVAFSGVPTEDRSPNSCSLIPLANKIGEIQRTWYGDKTFSVRSYADAKNIAYTSLPLDLHMDLLHFQAPPRWQFLHSLHVNPSLEGGLSYFVDAFRAAEMLKEQDRAAFDVLCREKVAFEYNNDGHRTFSERPTFEFTEDDPDKLYAVNYSPPFQAPFRLHPPASRRKGKVSTVQGALGASPTAEGGVESAERVDPTERIRSIHSALSAYSKILNDPSLRFEMQLQPGDCVAFDNRRVLHARTGFKAAEGSKGEVRWLMGCYLDETSVRDRYRFLSEQTGWMPEQ